MKRLLLFTYLFLASFFVISQTKYHILTEEDVVFENNTIKDYRSHYSFIIIPSHFGEDKVTIIGESAFYGARLKDVILPQTIVKLDVKAFYDNNLTKINLPSSLNLIEKDAFTENNFNNGIELPNRPNCRWKSGINSTGYLSAIGEKELIRTQNTKKIISFSHVHYLNSEKPYHVKEDELVFNNNTIYDYYGPAGQIVLPDRIKDEKVLVIDESAFITKELTHVKLPFFIREIGYVAFYNNKIQNITFPDCLSIISDEAFKKNRLTSVKLPTALQYLGGQAFSRNPINSVALPDKKFDGQWWFTGQPYRNDVLTSEQLIKNPSSVNVRNLTSEEDIEYFADNYTLKDGDILIKGNKIIKYFGPSGNITIPSKINDSDIKSLNGFDNRMILSLKIEEGIEDIGNDAFKYCSIKQLSLPVSLKSIGSYAFFSNEVSEIQIPDAVVDIGISAFSNNNISLLILHDNIRSIHKYAFSNNNLSSLHLPKEIRFIGYEAFSTNKLTTIILPEKLQIIGRAVFSNNQIKENVELPDCIQYVGEECFGDIDYIFPKTSDIGLYDVSNNDIVDLYASLKERYKSDLMGHLPYKLKRENENLHLLQDYEVEIENNTITAYYSKYVWDKIKIPKTLQNQEVKCIGKEVFRGCKFTEVQLPITLVDIQDRAFQRNNLSELIIPNNVKRIGNMAFQGNEIRKLSLPSSLNTIGDYAFYSNRISVLTIPDNVTRIGSSAFERNPLMSKVILGDNLRVIESKAFYENPISTINYGKSLEIIGDKAFFKNKNLKINIPKSVKYIGKHTFSYNKTRYLNFEDSSNLNIIYNGAFYGNFLDEVSLPSSLDYLGEEAFDGNDIEIIKLPENKKWIKNTSGIEIDDININELTSVYSVKEIPEDIVVLSYINGGNGNVDLDSNPSPLTSSRSGTNLYCVYRKGDDISINLSPENGYEIDQNSFKLTAIKTDTILNFETEPIVYFISFDDSFGLNPLEYNINDKEIILPQPNKVGHNFEGWYEEEQTELRSTILVTSTRNWVLKAKWKTVEYSIVYQNVDDNFEGKNTYTVYDKPFSFNTPQKKKYVFDGWYLSSDFDEGTRVEQVDLKSPKGLTLYAKWITKKERKERNK